MPPCSFLSSLLVAVATAHHSTAEFDYTKQLTIKGTVKEVQWTNPHSYIQLLVPGEGGQLVEWSVEIGSPASTSTMGWKKNSVNAGDEVTMLLVAGAQWQPVRHAARADVRRRPRAQGRRRRESQSHAPPAAQPCRQSK